MYTQKRMHLLGLICAFFIFSSPALAIDLYGFASYWDKGDIDGKAGFGIGLGVPVFSDYIRLDSRIHFVKDSTFDGNDELTLIPFDVGLQAHLMPGMSIDPYALAGVSFVYADADKSDVDSSFGGYLGGGVEWTPFHIASFFGEAVYRFHELSGSRGSHIDLSGMTWNIGVRFSF
ncbi:outer membrane beta-barrel protein [Desulfobulbus oligotrophicus]|uniref:Outer membrane beta-barrel protein n=1 Tax=Desulfobulbus oligotrophicus TaxID=1909699 RepID=A0A7T6ARK5_9BACT|nr:outer membrane beta-barrel protein [Desulfobulbus oligotrophicus]QQG66663.1 outer membrane beta-barrel protein [Desulfobulbus oligotrophicus]